MIASSLDPIAPALSRVSSPDGAVTLMLGDIADAAEMAKRLGAQRWDRVLLDHRHLVEQIVGEHDGQVIKFEGDGFVASFQSAHAGLHAAVDLPRTFTGSPPLDGWSLAVRAGLHSGFLISHSEQLLGRNVVLAARIAAAAGGGEILVSGAVKKYTENDRSFQFEARGQHHFRGLIGEHEIYAVSWS